MSHANAQYRYMENSPVVKVVTVVTVVAVLTVVTTAVTKFNVNVIPETYIPSNVTLVVVVIVLTVVTGDSSDTSANKKN